MRPPSEDHRRGFTANEFVDGVDQGLAIRVDQRESASGDPVGGGNRTPDDARTNDKDVNVVNVVNVVRVVGGQGAEARDGG